MRTHQGTILRAKLWMTMAAALLAAALPVVAQAAPNKNPGVIPLGANAYGNSYGKWSARWAQWAFGQPLGTNPILDETGEHCAVGQTGPVWFLAGTFGSTAERECTVPPGKALFFPLVNAIFGAAVFDCEPSVPGVPCDVDTLRAAAATAMDPVVLEASVDGVLAPS